MQHNVVGYIGSDPLSTPDQPNPVGMDLAEAPAIERSPMLRRLADLAVSAPNRAALRVDAGTGMRVFSWCDTLHYVDHLARQMREQDFRRGDDLLLIGALSASAVMLTLATWQLGGNISTMATSSVPASAPSIRRPVIRNVSVGQRVVRLFVYATDPTGHRALMGLHLADPQPTPSPLLIQFRQLPVRSGIASAAPAVGYWLEECSQDLGKLTALVTFWLTTEAALSLPDLGQIKASGGPRPVALMGRHERRDDHRRLANQLR